MFKKLISILIISIAFISVFTLKVNADSNLNSVKLQIEDNLNTKIDLLFNLKDNSNVNFLTGFQFTVPFKINLNSISAKLNDSEIDSSSTSVDGQTIIKIETENLTVDLSKDTILNLQFDAPKLVKDMYGLKYLYMPAIQSNFKLDNLNYTITYPIKFPKTSFISSRNISQNDTGIISAETSKSLLIIWGEEASLDLKLNYSINNVSDSDKAYLINLPSNLNQSTYYRSFPNVDGGVYDEYNDNFAVKNVSPSDTFKVYLDSNISLIQDNSNQQFNIPKYNWTLNTDSLFVKNLLKKISKENDFKTNLNEIDNYLVENLTPYSSERLDIKSISDIWSKLGGSAKLSSIEYCYLAISASEYLGYKGNLVYGYMFLPNELLSNERQPHVWCEINDGNSSYFIDPFLEDVFNIDYNFKEPMDRIIFGRWHPGMDYNNILGLISVDSDPVSVNISDGSNIEESNKVINIDFKPQDGDLYSGDYYSADLGIENKSNYFLELNSIGVDGHDYLSALKTDNFYPALIPGKATIFTFSNLLESDSLYNGFKDLEIKVGVDENKIDSSSLSTSKNVFFKIDIINLLRNLIFIALFIVLLVFIYKFVLEKRVRKILKIPEKQEIT